jgi:hypothetical protein
MTAQAPDEIGWIRKEAQQPSGEDGIGHPGTDADIGYVSCDGLEARVGGLQPSSQRGDRRRRGIDTDDLAGLTD